MIREFGPIGKRKTESRSKLIEKAKLALSNNKNGLIVNDCVEYLQNLKKNKKMSKLTDSCRMPFGKHKGEKMANVPASYLLWLKNNVKDVSPPVLEYINENLDILKEENGNFDASTRNIN